MPKSSKSKKSRGDLNRTVQISDVAPLAQRTKGEQKQFEKLQKFSKELNKDAYVKAVRLMKGEWNPFPQHRRCFAISRYVKDGVLVQQKLVLEFKNAVLKQNWSNAVELAIAIFKQYSSINEKIHLKVLIAVLMNHPKVDEKMLTNTCSFLWKMDSKEAMAELIRCFCSMPKNLPTEFVFEDKAAVKVRTTREFKDRKSLLGIKYTAHIQNDHANVSEHDMYIE